MYLLVRRNRRVGRVVILEDLEDSSNTTRSVAAYLAEVERREELQAPGRGGGLPQNTRVVPRSAT